jgi:hypothetical protein
MTNFIRTYRVGETMRVEMHIAGRTPVSIDYGIEQLGALISMLVDQERDLLKVLTAHYQPPLPPFLG